MSGFSIVSTMPIKTITTVSETFMASITNIPTLKEAIVSSIGGSTVTTAIFTATWMTGMILTVTGMVVDGTVGGTRGILVDGMAIPGIMIITTINVVVGIVRRAIMAKAPLISILGGDNDLLHKGDCATSEKEQ